MACMKNKSPNVNLVQRQQRVQQGIYILAISRPMIEKFYGMSFTKRLHEDNHEPWRQEFSRKYGNKKVRAIFAKNFVKVGKM